MKQATTPTLKMHTNLNLTDVEEIRVAMTTKDSEQPGLIKTLSGGSVTKTDHDMFVSLTQQEATSLKGIVTIDVRVKTVIGKVLGFKRVYVQIDQSYDTVVI